MRVLVTGGAGYIGSVTAAELLRAGHDVLVVDNLVTGFRAAVPEGARFAEGDLADEARVDEIIGDYRPDGVMHFAALSQVGESVRQPGRYFRNNVANTLNLLDSMVRHDVKRLVFSSTAAAYGEATTFPLTEETPTAPINPYGISKVMVEQMLEWYDRCHGLRYATLRYFNAAGAWHAQGEAHNPETHLIPLVLQVALGQREHVAIFGTDYPTPDGTAIRDYIHVADLAQAHILAMAALDEGSRLYNLGNGTGFSVREVIEGARRVTGHPLPTVEQPRRAGDIPILVASSERISEELGWEPRFADLDTIIAHAWEWHRAHPNGYGDVSSQTSDVR